MKLKDIRLPKETKLPRKKKKAMKKHLLERRYIIECIVYVHVGVVVSNLISKLINEKIAA